MKRCCLVTVEMCSAVRFLLVHFLSQEYRSGTTFFICSCNIERVILKSFDAERVKSLLNTEYSAMDLLPIYSGVDYLLKN